MLDYFTEGAFNGAKRTVHNDIIYLKCPVCYGSGEVATSHRFDCSSCKGLGRLTIDDFKNKIMERKERGQQKNATEKITSSLSALSINELQAVEEFIKDLKKERAHKS